MTEKPYITGLTGLRGYAALWVMLFHLWKILTPLYARIDPITPIRRKIPFDTFLLFNGWAGVHIFFVLTGFFLFLPLLAQSGNFDIIRYFKRRCLRILPAYYAQMAIIFTLSMFGIVEISPVSSWLNHLFMVHNFSSVWTGDINGVWWTLPVEFDFYIVLPILFLITRKTGVIILVIIALLVDIEYKMMVFPHIAMENIEYRVWIMGQLPGKIGLFAWGMAGASLYHNYHQKLSLWKYRKYLGFLCFAMGAIGGWVGLMLVKTMGGKVFWGGDPLLFYFDAVMGFCIMLIVLGVTMGDDVVRVIFSNRVVVYLGTISYSVYLWHLPLLKMIVENDNFLTGHIFVKLGVFLILTFLVSDLSYRFVEKPFMRMGRNSRGERPHTEPLQSPCGA